jgi:hypothetical protein
MKTSLFSKWIISSLLVLMFAGCSLLTPKSSATLTLEAHPLTAAANPEPLTFQPVEGTQDEVLALHATERALVLTNEVTMVDNNPAMKSLGDSSDLQAIVLTAAQGTPVQTVKLMRGDNQIFEAPGGLPSPALPVQSLWSYNGHWALEILYSDETMWAGRIYIDGTLINDKNGYQDAFGFQLLGGKPFFFFNRAGKLGYSYDGKESELPYTEIPHYYCCAESGLNPIHAQNMVAFFAKQNDNWNYVELGLFSK